MIGDYVNNILYEPAEKNTSVGSSEEVKRMTFEEFSDLSYDKREKALDYLSFADHLKAGVHGLLRRPEDRVFTPPAEKIGTSPLVRTITQLERK